MKRFTSPTQKIGKIGEDIAKKFLMKHGYSIIERNFTTKYGEIDIVASKDREIYFCEVKTIRGKVTHETQKSNVSRETYNPFENITQKKLKNLHIASNLYLQKNSVSHETNWHISGVSVIYDKNDQQARVEILENLVL
jgi:putative endonuclease